MHGEWVLLLTQATSGPSAATSSAGATPASTVGAEASASIQAGLKSFLPSPDPKSNVKDTHKRRLLFMLHVQASVLSKTNVFPGL